MQVTIGIKHATRELRVETSASQEEVLATVAHADTQSVVQCQCFELNTLIKKTTDRKSVV